MKDMRDLSTLMCGLALLLLALVATPSRASARAPGDELPDGEGKKILLASCTSCHDLEEVTKFRGFYARDEWRDIVQTMVDYGATLEEGQGEVLVEYLAKHLGKEK